MFKIVVTLLFLGFAFASASQIEPKNPVTCEVCVLLVKAAEGLVQQNKTETEIIQFVESQLCTKLGALAGLCKQYIEAYGAQVIEELIQKVKPEDICKKIGLCTTRLVDVPKVALPRNELYCTVCQYAVQFLDSELKNNRTEEAVVQALDKVCKIAPASLRDQCNSLVNSYGIYLVQLLIEFADPLKVCQAISLC